MELTPFFWICVVFGEQMRGVLEARSGVRMNAW